MKPDLKENLIQNLKDAGCCEQRICDFMEYFAEKNVERQISLLELQREELLEHVHREDILPGLPALSDQKDYGITVY